MIGAWNKGKKGNGYIRFSRTFKSTLSDSFVKDIRHITLQWSSAHNTFENIHSFVDFNVHGGVFTSQCYLEYSVYHSSGTYMGTHHPYAP